MIPNLDPDDLERIREVVAQNELRAAIDLLTALLKEVDRDLYGEMIIQSGRLVQLRRDERQGQLTAVEVRIDEAKLRGALNAVIDEIPRRIRLRALAAAPIFVRFEPPPDMSLEKIIGANNLKSIAWLRRGLEVARAVCRVVTHDSWGTGFLVTGHLLITNHHVLPDRATAADPATRVEFGYEEDLAGLLQPSTDYSLKPETFRTDAGLDFTAVEVDAGSNPTPLESWGALELTDRPEPRVGEHVTIIQHPLGGPKQVAITANQVVNTYEFRLQYTTDTQPGSSGSPVLDDRWKVIAIHHAGGDLVKNARGEKMYANEGILASYLLAKHFQR
jgi:V8-like Glu-specific endopeptidase